MFFTILWIIIGMILLVKGADFLVKGAAAIAKKFGLSEMMIGLTIVAIGTSLPEVFITLTSAVQGRSDLIIGNAIGSCICNFLLVVGLAAVIKPIRVDNRIIKSHIPIGICAMLMLFVLGNSGFMGEPGFISKTGGIILLVATALYILYTIFEEKNRKDNETPEEKAKEKKEEKAEHTAPWKVILYIVLGILGLKYGADLVVDNAVTIAEGLGWSEAFISMTIIAIGTALPEIVTAIMASIRSEGDLILGNVAGSNILNLCLLIGIGAVISPLVFSTTFNSSITLLMVITVLIALIATWDKDNLIKRKQGIILILIYIIYLMKLS